MELIVKINSNPGDLSYQDGDIVQQLPTKGYTYAMRR